MRKRLQIAAFALMVYFCNANKDRLPSVDEILQTNQYFLVSQQDGVTSIETDVAHGRCPQFMSKPKTNRKQIGFFNYVGAHLIRDPLARSTPLLMIITQNKTFSRIAPMNYIIDILALNVTSLFQSSHVKVASFVNTIGSYRHIIQGNDIIKSTMFDTSSHMLYLDFSSADNFKMQQYYLENLYTRSSTVHKVHEYLRGSSSSRYDWQEDPYAQKFYYKEKVDNEVGLFEIPMSALIRTIYEGEAGMKIAKLHYNGVLSGASGGAFFTRNKTKGGSKTALMSSLVPISFNAGFSCSSNATPSDLPSFQKLIIIKNQDYCMLRDGSSYNHSTCDQQQREYLNLEAEGESEDIVKWLLVTCIVMFMTIVLLVVYIYWLRSTFVSDYDRTHPNEYETEASLFVAKQRSFPSVYQDPALLDVSVDKWN